MGAPPDFAAIVLAGGRGTRLGADKPGVVVGGRTLVAWAALAARQAGAAAVVVVGPERPELTGGAVISFRREDPPGAGPVPALRAGLDGVTAPVVTLLAADLPFLRAAHVRWLRRVLGADDAGVVALDGDGQPQWLISCWRAGLLRAALAGYRGGSLRGVLGGLNPVLAQYPVASGEPPPWLDCDTPDDLAAARRYAGDGTDEHERTP